MPEDNKLNIIGVFSFTGFLDVILETKTVSIRNITSVGNGEYCIPYFPAHKTHHDFFVRNFRKKK